MEMEDSYEDQMFFLVVYAEQDLYLGQSYQERMDCSKHLSSLSK